MLSIRASHCAGAQLLPYCSTPCPALSLHLYYKPCEQGQLVHSLLLYAFELAWHLMLAFNKALASRRINQTSISLSIPFSFLTHIVFNLAPKGPISSIKQTFNGKAIHSDITKVWGTQNQLIFLTLSVEGQESETGQPQGLYSIPGNRSTVPESLSPISKVEPTLGGSAPGQGKPLCTKGYPRPHFSFSLWKAEHTELHKEHWKNCIQTKIKQSKH